LTLVTERASGYLPERPHPRWFGVALVALFVTALWIALIGSFRERAVFADENRLPAALPGAAATLRDWLAFPGRFERYFNDHFGSRNRLLAVDHWANSVIFRVSSVPTVLVGTQGWLYFMGEDGKAFDRWYRGIGGFTDAEVAGVRNELLRRRGYLEHLGIPYVVVVVPEKYSVYPEFLPDWVKRVTPTTALDRIADDLARHPELHFIDLRSALRTAKQSERVYYKTDSHWNFIGATVGYGVLMAELERRLPGLVTVPPRRPPYDPGIDFYSGDLSRMIGAGESFREDDIAPLWKILAETSPHCARRDPTGETPGFEFYVYACPSPPRYRALMYRDSMAIPLIPLLSENFARSTYVLTRTMDPALVERLKPDVVIEEMVERTLNALLAFPLQVPAR
jgi:alginate O-acetyltransferase complex protein AlgJ